MANRKYILLGALTIMMIIIAGCSSEQTDSGNDLLDQNQNPIIDGAQDNEDMQVIATVNGEPVTAQDIASVQELYLQQGQQVSQEAALENIIDQMVLMQAVQSQDIAITDEEAELMLQSQVEQQGMTTEQYKTALQQQGISYDEQLEAIKDQMATQAYLESQLEGMDLTVTDEEIMQLYQQYQNQTNETVPSYEEMEPQIRAALQQQKQQALIDAHIQELRSDVDIQYNMQN